VGHTALCALPGLRGDVAFDGVDFRYPTRGESPVLRGLQLRVPAGRSLALVGGSGSGKSTVGALLTRLYDPQAGAVRLDGVDVRELDPAWLRSVVGVVAQEPALFAASVADNIRYGRAGAPATLAEVREAARLANADAFISGFPQGYDTLVGERGVQLSGELCADVACGACASARARTPAHARTHARTPPYRPPARTHAILLLN
jgi:ABC-type multidrug transport system fused ATPase/permease subunit